MSAGYKTKRQLLEEVRAPHRINKVLITGNGFDVALGYKTSFKDFIKFSKEYIKDKNNDREEFFKILSCNHLYKYFANRDINTWNNLESELEKIINGIIRTFDDNPIINKPLPYLPGMTKPIISIYDEMTKKVLTEFGVIQSSYYDSWIVNDFFEDEILWDKLIVLFEKDLEKFVEAFTLYLNKFLLINSADSIIDEESTVYKVIKSIEPDYIQTFNYTEIYKDVYTTSYAKHLHGKAKDNSIILGYEKESDEYRFANYRKSFQRINKKVFPIQPVPDFNVFDMVSSDQMENGEMIMKENLFFFYGFSFDSYDSYYVKHVLSRLGEKGKIIIYYHNESSKKEMIINLLKIIGNDELYKKYFESSIMFLKTDVEFSIEKYFCNGYSWGRDK